ncbi:PCL2 [Candida oxycetoniae]|uniref:PCL2 n=1 Tax=Candida oxycetoniae TaxID=497107 RepID=A0AAI9T1A7_9ASCO|nr:PCL2 [Candida oxycetoniae]KAI3406792.2 PCL2 [Candida oxycetoniae]
MTDREALRIFSRQPVSLDMINFLVATTNSIIQIKPAARSYIPCTTTSTQQIISIKKPTISLTNFIKNLIKYSNVQTPTLMATLVYLNKLRNYLPANAVGMETTRHRIFLSALIVAAKTLNDSSPLNKHWTKYTDGLLSLDEVNLAERELMSILKWNINIKEHELIVMLQPFLTEIKSHLLRQQEWESLQRIGYYRLSQKQSVNSNSSLSSSLSSSPSNYSLQGSSKSTSTSSLNSHLSLSNSTSSTSVSSYNEDRPSLTTSKRMPLSNKSINNLNLEHHNQYTAPAIKKKRSMMSLLSSSPSRVVS